MENKEFISKIASISGDDTIAVKSVQPLQEGAEFVTFTYDGGRRHCVAVTWPDDTVIVPDDWQSPELETATAKDIATIQWMPGVVIIDGLPRIF